MESQRQKALPNFPHPRPIGATRSTGYVPCRKHPNHRQSPGVCSLCLSQKLSELANGGAPAKHPLAKRSHPSSSPSSSSSEDLSSLSSSCASPKFPIRVSKTAMAARQNHHALGKSRSMAAFVPQRRREADPNGKKIARIKRGFWSKLLKRKSNKGKELMHSKTMNERLVLH